ncbi:MAG: acyl carrier protein [Acetatifactor sp.]|nr:acyl carrier protein [Acetatifactor sp.]
MSKVFNAVSEIIYGMIGRDRVITNETEIAELGLDSFQFIQLCVQIEKKMKIKIPDDKLDISEFVSISDYVEMIETLMK